LRLFGDPGGNWPALFLLVTWISRKRGFSLSAGVSDPLREVDSPAVSAVQTLGNFAPDRYLVGKP
jgi:hypothetical protein